MAFCTVGYYFLPAAKAGQEASPDSEHVLLSSTGTCELRPDTPPPPPANQHLSFVRIKSRFIRTCYKTFQPCHTFVASDFVVVVVLAYIMVEKQCDWGFPVCRGVCV